MTTVHHAADQRVTITLMLNGQRRTGQAEPRMLLSDFLRHELQAFGVHVGCEHGVCGACTVLVDRRAVRSCTQYAVQADGTEIVTVEGLADGDALNVVQRAFGKRGKTGGGMNLRFTGGHELDSFWECCRPPTSMAYRTPI